MTGLVAALGIACCARPALAAAPGCDREPEATASAAAIVLQRVSANVWRVPAARGESDAVNAGRVAQLVVVREVARDEAHAGTRVWLIGSGPTPAFGIALACAVQRTLGYPVSDVVTTRAAPELAMGNSAFARARLWALPDVIAAMRVRCEACLARLKARIGAAGESLRPESLKLPSRPVGRPGAVRGMLGPFEWRALAREAGERSLVLRHRRDRVLIAQGLVWAGGVPNLREANAAVLSGSLHELKALAVGARLLGEQGDVAGPEAIDQQLRYLAALRLALAPRVARGEVDGAAGAGTELPAFAGLPGYAQAHPLNAQRLWRELEAELFR